jgi:hypothetical protein
VRKQCLYNPRKRKNELFYTHKTDYKDDRDCKVATSGSSGWRGTAAAEGLVVYAAEGAT